MADEADIVLADWGTSSFVSGRWTGRGPHCRTNVAPIAGWARLSTGRVRTGTGPLPISAMDVDGDVPVLICGMAGAAQGWQEAQYSTFRAILPLLPAPRSRSTGSRRDIRILPGMAQRDIACPDVMRGEETILYGLVCQGIEAGLVCLPGTHAKWARLSGGTDRFSHIHDGRDVRAPCRAIHPSSYGRRWRVVGC